jgi:hypothetical protein
MEKGGDVSGRWGVVAISLPRRARHEQPADLIEAVSLAALFEANRTHFGGKVFPEFRE